MGKIDDEVISDDILDEDDVLGAEDQESLELSGDVPTRPDTDKANTDADDIVAALVQARTLNELIRKATDDYLDKIDPDNPPSPSDIEADLVKSIRIHCDAINAQHYDKASKIRAPQKLAPSQIASIMLKIYHIVRIQCGEENSDPSEDLLAMYQDSGENEGIYVTDEVVMKRTAAEYNYTISKHELDDVIEFIKIHAPRVYRTVERDLVPVNNGVFNFETKELMPFSPDYVFIAKSKVDYNPHATNVVIHNDDDGTDWDVESWVADLSDDPEIVNLLWEVMSAIVRPFVGWNKSAWFYSNTGNNGKGTLCELMRQLCGSGSYASISLSEFGKDFALAPLTRANAIIVDENDVGTFIDKAGALKSIITNDVFEINRKHKDIISYRFYGFMVQCLNEFPRVKDKSDSFYRRQLFIPFDKCFTGRERKYIKKDYLHRKEVLEYVLYKVLNMNFYSLSEPASCVSALAEYKGFNDPVRQFMDEVSPQLVWDLVPFSFLYDLYKSWFRKNSPNGSIQGKTTFITDIINLLGEYPDWSCQGRNVSIRPGHKMDAIEHMIAEYDLRDWQNPTYTGVDVDKICMPKLKASYNGLIRVGVSDSDVNS